MCNNNISNIFISEMHFNDFFNHTLLQLTKMTLNIYFKLTNDFDFSGRIIAYLHIIFKPIPI